jgi:endonuclease/exonuclease/phosphatase family metal-dependent hydrolase
MSGLQFCSKPDVGPEINLMTFNIRYDNPRDSLDNWHNRKDNIVSLINFYGSQVVGIQEGLIHQVQFLDENLENFSYVGVGRDDGKEKGEFSAIFVDTMIFRVNKSETFWLSETPEKVSVGWDASMERICTWAELTCKSNNRKIIVYNTHFDHIGKEARLNSVKLILEK